MEPNPDYIPQGTIRVLRNASVVLPDRLTTADVVLRGRVIQALEPAGQARGGEVWDLRGHRVMPGFIDLHTHGGWGVDLSRDSKQACLDVAESYGHVGVTRLLITLVPGPWSEMIERLRFAYELCQANDAFLGIHLEGPFLSRNRLGALPEAGIYDYTHERMNQLLDAASGALRLMTFAPEAVPTSVLAKIRQQGVMLSIGHTVATKDETRAAIHAGAWRATHLCNAMPALHHRSPGPILPLLADENVRVEVIADGEHLDDDWLEFVIKVKGAGKVIAVSDSMPLTGMGPASAVFAGSEVVSDGCRATHHDGTLAGSITPLSAAVLRLERELGLSPAMISQLGSIAPAADLGLPRTARVARDYRADLVIVDSDGRVVSTLRAGARVGADPGDAFLPEGFERVE